MALQVMRKVSPLSQETVDAIAVQSDQTLRRARDEAKRTSNHVPYRHLVGITRLTRTVRSELDPSHYDMLGDWVDNNFPRDVEVADELVARTLGFGLADDNAQIVAEFKTIAEAERAAAGATFHMAVDIPDDGPPPPEPVGRRGEEIVRPVQVVHA